MAYYPFILMCICVGHTVRGLLSSNNLNIEKGRHSFILLFTSAIIGVGVEVVQWLVQ